MVGSMKSLGIYHWTYNNRTAVDASIKSFRTYHPDAPYFLACDAGADHYDICKKYNVEYLHSQTNIGYPVWPGGHTKINIFHFLQRMMIACVSMNTTHFVVSEDDVHCINPIQFDESWEIAAYNQNGNPWCYFNDEVQDAVEEVSGVRPKIPYYGAGAGVILKTSTFIENYYKVLRFLDKYYDDFHSRQPTFGWNDYFIHMFYCISGKDYSVNPRLFDIGSNWPNPPDLNSLKDRYDMVHKYKVFYER
jgi:hypothetical protein